MIIGESLSQRMAREERQAQTYPELGVADVPTVLQIDDMRRQEGRAPTSFGMAVDSVYSRLRPPTEDNPAGELLNPAMGPVGPMGPYGQPTPPSTGNPGLDAQLARQASGFGDRNIPQVSAGESVGYLGQVAGVGAELATSSYADALGLPDNWVTQELTRPVNYIPFGKGVSVARAATEAVGGRAAQELAQPAIEQLPESWQGAANLGVNIAGQVATGGIYGRSGGAVGMGIKDVGGNADEAAQAASEVIPAPKNPVDILRESISNAKPLQDQNKELLKQFRSRQAGGFAGTGGVGEGGFNQALSAMRGSAERVSFEPLRGALDQPAIDSLFDKVRGSGLRPFEQANAGAALRDLLDGTVPTPSELAKLEEVMPGLTEALRGAKIVSGPSIWEEMKAIAAIPQSIMSSLDLSGFRQTATAAYAHPLMAADAFKKSLSAAKSEANFQALHNDLQNRWYAPMRREAGVRLSDGEQGLTQAEGTLASKMLNNLVPGYRASQRAYAVMLNEMRDGLFQRMLSEYGGPAEQIPVDELKRWGRMVNITTGRGLLPGGLADSHVAGSPIFWAPRLLASRVEMPFELLSSSPQVRKEVARQLVSFVGVNSAILGMGKAAGIWDVEANPTSADFGQIRIGQTRIDPWAGFRPIANLIARLKTGERKSTTTGAVSDVGMKQVVGDFLRQKFSPITSLGANLWTGENQIGEPVSLDSPEAAGKVAYEALTPLFIQNIVDAVQRGGPRDVALSGIAGLGIGVNTYSPNFNDTGFENLTGEAKLKAIPAEVWRALGNPGGSGSYYTWKNARIEADVKMLVKEGVPEWQARQDAEQAIESDPISESFSQMSNDLERQWSAEHPEELQALLEREMKKNGPDRRIPSR